MINGVRVRDSGVELSPTGTDRRGGPRTASNRTVRASSAIAPDRRGGSCGGPNGHFRPLRRTGLPMATDGHLWPPLYSQVAHCYALAAQNDTQRTHRARGATASEDWALEEQARSIGIGERREGVA